MNIRSLLQFALAAVSAELGIAQQQPAPRQESLANRIVRMSEAEQIAYTNSVLDQGMQVDDGEPLGVLIRARRSLVLPMMERKIEEVLKSEAPLDLCSVCCC
jgi:hypothetical protein